MHCQVSTPVNKTPATAREHYTEQYFQLDLILLKRKQLSVKETVRQKTGQGNGATFCR